MADYRSGMEKTRRSFFSRITNMLSSNQIDDETWDDIEAVLIQADLGVNTAIKVVEDVRCGVSGEGLRTQEDVQKALRQVLTESLAPPPVMNISGRELSIILVVGVNGSGKTTSIGKLANRLRNSGRNVIIAAGDTFRAAAIEQLQKWGERVDVPVVANKPGSDPAALVFDATKAAKARGKDILIIDTAGRLHNNFNLMAELAKIKAVMAKVVPDAPHEVLLVLDGTTGQNALEQAKHFTKTVDVSGVIVTKLDGSAKGGMVFSIYNDLNLPIQYIGLGEGMYDLVNFSPENFVLSLFDEN